jgi:hypothetical protein
MDIIMHRLRPNNRVVFGVMFPDADSPLEVWTELEVQKLEPTLLYEYWASKGGRTAATNFERWNVFKILKHRGHSASTQYEVQWVSHPEDDTTWEPLEQLWDDAQAFVCGYHHENQIPLPNGYQPAQDIIEVGVTEDEFEDEQLHAELEAEFPDLMDLLGGETEDEDEEDYGDEDVLGEDYEDETMPKEDHEDKDSL